MRGMQWLRRLFKRDVPQIPASLWHACVERQFFLDRLSRDELNRLKRLCEDLLSRKTFTGVAGLVLTDEIAVNIAVQACLPVLNLTLDLYDDMAGIIVYPSAFVIPQSEMDEAGVVHEWREPIAGEAVGNGGAVVLSWEDVEDADAGFAGYNVVIHEFAHKLDMGRGAANGCPPLLTPYHKNISTREWQNVFSAAYEDFIRRVDALETDTAIGDDPYFELPLDPYAATDPAEFFAVASEAFFLAPQPLAADYPDVYRLLTLYYLQETLSAERP